MEKYKERVLSVLLCYMIMMISGEISQHSQALFATLEENETTILHNGRTMARVRVGNNSLETCTLSVV